LLSGFVYAVPNNSNEMPSVFADSAGSCFIHSYRTVSIQGLAWAFPWRFSGWTSRIPATETPHTGRRYALADRWRCRSSCHAGGHIQLPINPSHAKRTTLLAATPASCCLAWLWSPPRGARWLKLGICRKAPRRSSEICSTTSRRSTTTSPPAIPLSPRRRWAHRCGLLMEATSSRPS